MSAAPQWDAWLAVGVSVHLRPGTRLDSTAYPDENRAVLHLRGANFTDVHLFADRPELARLADAVNAARDALEAAITGPTATAVTDPKDAAHAA